MGFFCHCSAFKIGAPYMPAAFRGLSKTLGSRTKLLACFCHAASVHTRGQVCMVRMQSDARLPAADRLGYKHIGDALFRIGSEEGVRTYWRGATPTGKE